MPSRPGGGSYVGAKVQYGTFLSGNYLVFCIVHVLSDDTSWASTSGVHGCAARGSVQLSDCSRENNKGEENLLIKTEPEGYIAVG